MITRANAGRATGGRAALARPAPEQPPQQRLADTRGRAHPRCIVCGGRAGHAPRLRFAVAADGSVEAQVTAGERYAGYRGMLHGGIIATLLDAAMTNCLFARGHSGVAADLHVRYRHPVLTGVACALRAWIERCSAPLFVLRAELSQDGQCKATAVGKFLARAGSPGPDGTAPPPR